MTEQPENSSVKSFLLARLEMYGDPRKTAAWEDGQEDYVAKLGLSAGDVPELLAIARTWAAPQNDWPDDEGYIAGYAPIHAWRCLAQLRAVEAIPVLLEMLDPLCDIHDDWHHEEFPDVFAWIGPLALKPLCDHLADRTHRTFSRVTAAHGLKELAQKYPQVRDETVKTLIDTVALQEPDVALNGLLTSFLLDLKKAGVVAADEIAEVIERGYATGHVDTIICGNWNTVRAELGVEGLGLVPEESASRRPFAQFDWMRKSFLKVVQAQDQAQLGALASGVSGNGVSASGPAGRGIATVTSRTVSKVGRNDPCHCGSGKKYKKCCAK